MHDDSTGMQKSRLQLKEYWVDGVPTLYVRATNGHTRPGVLAPESLYFPLLNASRDEDTLQYYIHGTY